MFNNRSLWYSKTSVAFSSGAEYVLESCSCLFKKDEPHLLVSSYSMYQSLWFWNTPKQCCLTHYKTWISNP